MSSHRGWRSSRPTAGRRRRTSARRCCAADGDVRHDRRQLSAGVRRAALARDLRRRRAARTGTAGQRSLPRRAPRARASGRDPHPAIGVAPELGGRARALSARGAGAAGRARSIIQVRDYGEEPRASSTSSPTSSRGRACASCCERGGRCRGPRLRPLLSQLLEAARVLHRRKALLCGSEPRDHADPPGRIRGRRRTDARTASG